MRFVVRERVAPFLLGLIMVGALAPPPEIAAAQAHDAGAARSANGGGHTDDYRKLIDEAVREAAAKNYEEARALFLRAHALAPSARTHRGIAMTEFELRNYEACITHIDAALASTVQPLDDKLRHDAEELRRRAQSFLGTLKIETRPQASAIRVDGVPTTLSPDHTLTLQLGEHVIEAELPGHASEKRQVGIRGAEHQTLTILFARPIPAAPSNEPVARRAWYKNPWLWGAVGVVAAGAAAGTAVAATRGDKQTFDRGTASILVKP